MHSPAALDSLESALERAVSRFDDDSSTGEQMRHHLGFDATGEPERLHASLTLAAAREEGGATVDALDPACAVEIVSACSLIHEDIEDGIAQRAGRPAVWSRYGLAHGINAGDALCAVAYLALLDPVAQRDPAATVAMTRVLQNAHLAMCGGHGRAIAFERERRISLDEYVAMIDGKTGALIGAACSIGALAAGATPERAQAYARLGTAYGRALHIAGDLRRTWDDAQAPAGVAWTFPVVWALAHETTLEAPGTRAAVQAAIDAEIATAGAYADAAGIDANRTVRTRLGQALQRRSS